MSLRNGMMAEIMPAPVRLAVVPPAPVPYREPLLAALAAREALTLRVIYQAARSAAWDQAGEWFPAGHAYDAEVLRARQRPRPGRTPIVWPIGLERALDRFDPGCVVVSEFGPAALRALAWCRRRRRALVVLTEVTAVQARGLPRAQRRLHAWLARRAHGFVATSSAARERLLALGVAPGQVEVSVQSADLEAIAAAAAARPGEREPGPVRILTVARLVADKNVGGLLEALGRAGLRDGEAELEVCGGGPLEAGLRAEAERRGLPVRFAGWVAPGELPARYARADAFALVSRVEPFGVAVREAAAAGLPIVCTRVAGAAGDVAVAERNALLVDPDDPDAIAVALGRLVRDPALRARLAAGSRELAAARGLEADVDAFERAVLRAAGR
jgi:glycosyltransferase involved in cell wall biosynthesis